MSRYVEQDEVTQRFRLGVGLLALTGPLLADMDVRRVALPVLSDLAQRTGESSSLVVWNQEHAVVVEQVPSPHEVRHTSAIGTRYATVESASVRVFLADLPADVLVGLRLPTATGEPLERRRVPELAQELAAERARGVMVNDGRTSPDEVGLSAAVHDHRGVLVGAVLISAPRFRMDRAALDRCVPALLAAAREVTLRLGAA